MTLYHQECIRTGDLSKQWVTPIEAHSRGKTVLEMEHWSSAHLATLTKRLSMHITDGKFCLISNFT